MTRTADYHLADVGPLHHPFHGLVGWVAYCDACGWAGPTRSTAEAARDDAAAHDLAENES